MTEPAHAPPPPLAEPKTPLWMPALGAALFFSVGLVWAATPPPPAPVTDVAAADAGADAPDDAAAAPDAAPAYVSPPGYVSVPAVQASAAPPTPPPRVTTPPKVARPRPKAPDGGH
jgi:hypothetical protein